MTETTSIEITPSETTPTETTPSNNKKYKVGDRTTLIGKIEFYGGISFAVYFTLFILIGLLPENKYIIQKYYLRLIGSPIILSLISLYVFYIIKVFEKNKDYKEEFRPFNNIPWFFINPFIAIYLLMLLIFTFYGVWNNHNYVFKYNNEQKKLHKKILLLTGLRFTKSFSKNKDLFDTNNNRDMFNLAKRKKKINRRKDDILEIRKIDKEYEDGERNYIKKLKQKIKEIEQQKKI